MRGRHPLELVYELGLRLLPPGPLRRDDRVEMVRTLRDQLEGARSTTDRLRIGVRALRRLPGAILAEWLAWLGIRGPASSAPRRRGDGMTSSWVRNLAFASRALRKSPTFAVATVCLVALGVGTVTSAFTVVDHVLLRPLPYPAADRLVYLTNGSHNGPTIERLDGVEAFDIWTVTSTESVNLSRPDGDPLRLRRTETTPDFFTLFGARPHLGRLLVDGDRNDLGIAVATYPFWRDVLGADPDAVGRTLLIDGEPVEIVGVLSEDFVHPARLGDGAQLYRPVDWMNPGLENPGYHAHSVTARLAEGVSLEQANQQVDRVEAAVAAAYGEYYSDGPQDWPLETLHATTVEDVQGGLYLLLGAVGLLLLVACANVAHLFMARGISRAREVSIRRAMGARTWHLVGQLSAESLVVGGLGAVGGLFIAWGTLVFFRRWTVELPRGTGVALDPRIFLVGIGLATLTAFLFGLVPALRTVGRDVQDGLRGGGRGMSGSRGVQSLRNGLVVFEVAISLVLVTSAGLLMRSFLSVTSVDPGVDVEDVWVLPLNVANIETPDDYRARMEPVRAALATIPGVTSVTFGIEAPFEHVGGSKCCWGRRMAPPDQPEVNPVRLDLHPVSEDYFEAYGTELVTGSVWTSGAVSAAPWPAVVSEPLAVRFFGSADRALGRELDVVGGVVIAGVAEATRHYGLDQPHDHALYLPMEALPFGIPRATFALRVSEASVDFTRRVREAVWSVEAELPVPELATLGDWVSRSSAPRRLGSFLFGAFGVVALLLAAAGLYGTLLYTVGQRRHELGIRLALGAGRSRIQGDVIRKGVIQAAIGVAAGALLTLWVGGLLESWLYGVTATDPFALASSAAVLFAAAVAASWLPAYRAGRTDPLETLKAE